MISDGRAARRVASGLSTLRCSSVPEREPLGLYLHIPFCESICNYCNFNRGLLDSELKTRYVDALTTEIIVIGDGAAVDTIYFGGGTPSLLDPDEVGRILNVCRDSFNVDPSVEVSLEVNPESATTSRLTGWRESGVTRLSFGVQSFRGHRVTATGAEAHGDSGQGRHAGCAHGWV